MKIKNENKKILFIFLHIINSNTFIICYEK